MPTGHSNARRVEGGEVETTEIVPPHHRPRALVIVAHPDDETLWSGGTIIMHPGWAWTVAVASRASDPDRAPRFARAMLQLATTGKMADVDDGPEQTPLKDAIVMEAIAGLVTPQEYDLVLTHGPDGEYTRHRRHEEVSRAVRTLWSTGAVAAGELWLFAYEDGGGSHLPRAAHDAHVTLSLPGNTWLKKQEIIEETYGFAPESFEARTCPRMEAFWTFRSPDELRKWLAGNGGQSISR